jgi:hypothetical protein
MKTISRILVIFTLALSAVHCTGVPAKAATLTILGLDSSSLLEGSPGQTVGFGFTFTNDTDYAILNFSEFDPMPSFADYTDYIANDYITTVPNIPVTEQFSQTIDPTTGVITETGLGQFAIHTDATVGQTLKGNLTLDYDLYSVDPNSPSFDPTQDGVSFGNEIVAKVGIRVVAAPAPVPEPRTLGLMAAAILMLGCALRKR